MNHKNLAIAVTTLLAAGLAMPASALPLNQYNAADTLDVYVSGASAQDNALELLFRRLCEANTLDIYRGPSGSNQRMMFCRISSAKVPGFPAAPGQKVMFHKSSVGGSGNGVQPVADNTALAFMNHNSTCDAGTSVPGTPDFPGYIDHNCSAITTTNTPPDAGISDVEPKLLGASAGQVNRLTVRSQNAVVFGVPVSKALRDALQEAQLLTPGAEDETNMPSLTRQQLASIYNGGISSWSQIADAQGFPLTTARDTGSNGTTRVPPSDSRVFVARRVATSGTNTSFRVYFLNDPCSDGMLQMVAGNDSGVCGSNTVNEGSGTSNVKACLNTHNGANRWAVGMFSTENVSNLGSDQWRFIKINGAAPTLLNVAESKYDFFMEQSIQWRKSPSPTPLAGQKLVLMNKIATDAGEPTIIQDLNTQFVHNVATGSAADDWQGGVMALITNGHVPPGTPLTAAAIAANPTLTSTKSPGGSPNNCQSPVIFFPTDVPVGLKP